MNNKNRLLVGYLFLIPTLLLFAVFVAYPVLNTIWTSFFSLRIQTLSKGGKFIGLSNYVKLFKDANVLQTMKFTVMFTFIAVALETVIGMGCALIMNRQFMGKNLVCAIILIPWCIPTVVSALMWSYMFAESYGVINQFLQASGLINTPIHWLTSPGEAFAAVVISDVWKTTPYMALLLLSGLKTIPSDLYEAAGAGRITKLFFITFPCMKPVIVVSVMFRTIASFRIYDLIKVLTNGGPGRATTSLTLYTMQQYFSFGNYGYGAALAVLTFVISLVIAFLFYDGMKSKLEVQ